MEIRPDTRQDTVQETIRNTRRDTGIDDAETRGETTITHYSSSSRVRDQAAQYSPILTTKTEIKTDFQTPYEILLEAIATEAKA